MLHEIIDKKLSAFPLWKPWAETLSLKEVTS